MAEGNDFAKADFENLEELITCGICSEILTEPKSIPRCLHTFCLGCIQRWSQSCQSNKKPVDCPSCRALIGAPGGDVASLPTSFHHKSLLQVYNSSASKKKSQEPKILEKEIASNTDHLNQVLDLCMTAVERTDEKIKKTDEEIALAKNDVRRNISVQIKILQKHEKAKLDHLDAICTRRKAEHEEVKNKISDYIQEILELNNKSQNYETINSAQLKTEEFKQLLDACMKSTIERTKSALSIDQAPCNPPILYIPNPEVIKILENLQVGEVIESLADPFQCSVECVQPTRCGFINQFSIVTRDSKGVQCYANKTLIDVNIQDTDGNTVPKEITKSENAKFTTKFKVKKPSPYNVVVNIAGNPIQNSPQRIKAIDAKAEFKPVRLFKTTRASCPQSLAMNGKGDIAVVNNKNGNECRIVLYGADGEYVREFGGDTEGSRESRLRHPCGVVFSNDNHILVSDNTDDDASIKEYHVDGILLRTVYKQKGEFFSRMCISGQNIACLSYNNQSKETSIMLFSRETGDHLQDVKLHAPDVKSHPMCLAYDNRNYFVTFLGVHKTFVLHHNGGLLYTIGKKGTKQGQFKHPFGLAVFGDNDMILVCDNGNHRVQLFHQNGDSIRSFGTHGSGLGQLKEPIDVAVTPDGQVLVLEGCSKRIQVFQ